jgi:hypothetical protein
MECEVTWQLRFYLQFSFKDANDAVKIVSNIFTQKNFQVHVKLNRKKMHYHHRRRRRRIHHHHQHHHHHHHDVQEGLGVFPVL